MNPVYFVILWFMVFLTVLLGVGFWSPGQNSTPVVEDKCPLIYEVVSPSTGETSYLTCYSSPDGCRCE